MSENQTIQIIPLKSEHVSQVAQLHIQNIKEGFISSLGHKFVCCLYQAIVESDKAFGFVAVKGSEVLGFASCVDNIGVVYMLILKRNFFKLLWACLPHMLRLKNIKSSIETLLYPFRCEDNLPRAELLSIVVDQKATKLGLGKKLVEASIAEFQRRGIKAFKTIAYELFPSNEFYKSVGFESVGKYCHHGSKDVHNVYVMKIPQAEGKHIVS